MNAGNVKVLKKELVIKSKMMKLCVRGFDGQLLELAWSTCKVAIKVIQPPTLQNILVMWVKFDENIQ